MVICLERGADLHMAQLTPLPLTVSCFSKIQIGFTSLVPPHPGSPGKRAVKRVCVCFVTKRVLLQRDSSRCSIVPSDLNFLLMIDYVTNITIISFRIKDGGMLRKGMKS